MYSTLLELLKESFEKYTGRTVYSDERGSMRYDELDKISGIVGCFVVQKMKEKFPADPVRHPVVVMTGRHIFTPAAYIGVARAGCFYAASDSSLPETRLNQILGVIDAPMLIVDRAAREKAQKLSFHGDIYIFEEILGLSEDASLNSENRPKAETFAGRNYNRALLDMVREQVCENDPLYVIFTSGSTGMPKGVITSHFSLMCYLDGLNDVLKLDDADVLGSQSPLDYIAAVRDLYLPHLCGGRTHIIPDNEFALPKVLFGTLKREHITTLCWSAAGVEMAAKMGGFETGIELELRRVIFSGSILPGKYLAMWQKGLPNVTFINQYGPTEATASCTFYVVKEQADENTVLPIGKPFKHYRVFLLNVSEEQDLSEMKDEDRTLVTSPGIVGEICVGGPAVALGYYGNAGKTEKSFVQNPVNKKYRDIIYKTGDLGRYNADGDIEFLGRSDRQVKLLGHRIELDEIEGTAMMIDGVSECCSMFDADKSLLYLFYAGDAEKKEIALYFRANMPAFMVPRKIMKLDALPKLPNGKKDMGAMRAMMK